MEAGEASGMQCKYRVALLEHCSIATTIEETQRVQRDPTVEVQRTAPTSCIPILHAKF
jgi:hypothetical protein